MLGLVVKNFFRWCSIGVVGVRLLMMMCRLFLLFCISCCVSVFSVLVCVSMLVVWWWKVVLVVVNCV